jgi:DNA-binding SARP family transcriptional activator/tetratricopeptide (TPR) repeat protein
MSATGANFNARHFSVVLLMPDDLRTIYERAQSRLGDDVWLRFSAHEQTKAVYEELRALDAAQTETREQRTRPEELAASGTTSPIVVRLRLAGQMQAWTVANENVLPTGRKTRALLASVALSAPRPASRARLAELLWSRRPEEMARASLRQEIQLLLRALAPAKTEILHVTREHLSLIQSATWVDFDEIMRPSTHRPSALSLLDGDLLEDLDGIDPSFDMWLTGERERLRDRARGMAESLLREKTDPATVIPAAHRLLQIDRAHEEAWRALMRAHAAQGERGMAIQAYDRCRAVLAELLDVAPSAETQALLVEIHGPSSKRLPTRPLRPVVETVTPAAVGDEAVAETSDEPHAEGGARIGVLPMRCVGLPDDVAYLGPSLANEITTALSRFRWMSVISLNSLARFARERDDGSAIKRTSAVDFLLDGAIQRSRNKLRITLRLLDLRADNQVVWARRFDRSADDLLSVQEEVAGEAAAQIDPVMLLIQAKRGAAGPDAGTSAWQLILRSVLLITRLANDGFRRAGENLTRAIELEPDHAPAHAWYAAWHVLLVSQGWAADPHAAGNRAADLAERAIVLDPYSAAVFTVAGHVRACIEHDPRGAAALHERALALNPNLAAAWALSAITHVLLGDVKEAERRYSRYKVLSPLDPYSFMFDGLFGMVHLLKGDCEAAVAVGRTVTQLNPSYSAGYKLYLAALGHLGRGQETGIVLQRLLAIEPNVTIERCISTFPLAREADRDKFAEGLRLAGVPLSSARELRHA